MKNRSYNLTDNELLQWILSNCTIDSAGCLNWIKGKYKSGYPKIKYNYKSWRGNRLVYVLYNGGITDSLIVRHTCHNKNCLNINHLILGNNQDNSDDMTNAGRQAKGEHSGQSVLTELQIIDIRIKYDAGSYSQLELANEYNVSRSVIGYVVRREYWKHVQ